MRRNQPGEGAAPGLYHLVHRAAGPRMGECTGEQGPDVLREPSPSWDLRGRAQGREELRRAVISGSGVRTPRVQPRRVLGGGRGACACLW